MKSSPSSFIFLLILWIGLGTSTCPPTFSCPLQGCERAQEPEPILSFCENYNDLSCCDYAEDTEVSIYILTEIAQTYGLQQCVSSFSELECGYKCDPRQQQFVNVIEGGLNEYVICRDFCERFYNNCKGSPFNGGFVEDFFTGAEEFCTNSGRDDVRIILSNDNCFNGPKMSASAEYSLVMDLHSNIAGDPNSFVVSVVNEIGLPVEEGGDLVELEVVSPSGEEVTWWATDYGDGSYYMTYEPEEAGLYSVTVTINDAPLATSPETAYSVEPAPCPVYNDRVTTRANPSLPICSFYDENACCSADDGDVDIVEDWLSGIRDTYGSSPKCVSLFETFACGLLCSPAQARFVNITSSPGGGTTTTGTTSSTGVATTSMLTTGAMSSTGGTTNSTTTAPISTTGVFTTTGGTSGSSSGTTGNTGQDIVGDYRVCGYFCYDLYLACSNVILMSGFTVQETFGSAAPFCQANNLYASRWNLKLVGSQCMGGQAEATYSPTSYYTDADTCLTAGETGTLTVQAVDEYLTKQTKFGEHLQVKFTGPVIFNVGDIEDRRDGTYVATYGPTIAGTYDVQVILNGVNVQNSPLLITVRPAEVSTASLVQGVQKVLDVGQIASFVIIARDQYGNLLTEGGDNFNVRLTGPEFVSVELIDNCDGTYIAIYTPTTPGTYTLHVDLDGVEFYTAKINVGQDGGGLPNQRYTFASGPGVTSPVQAGEETWFMIYVVDVNGNLVSTGGDLFVVTLVLENGQVIQVLEVRNGIVDNQDGTYNVTYTPNFKGFFWIYVTLDEANIRDSPFFMESIGDFECPNNCSGHGRCTVDGCICNTDDYGLDVWVGDDCGTAPDPFFAHVYFSSTGASIFAHFNIPTDQAGLTGEFLCSEIIVDDTEYYRMLGDSARTEPFCVFRNSSLLIVYLGPDATVEPGDVLLLKPGTVKSADGTSGFGVFSPYETDIIQLFLPPPIPHLVITGPTNISSCSPLELDASATYGTGGRNMVEWSWGVKDGPPSLQIEVLRIQLNQKTKSKMSLSSTLVADVLVSGFTYVFTVQATNFLGATSEVAEFPVYIEFYPIPLAVAQPSFFEAVTSRDLKLYAEGYHSGCAPSYLLSEPLVLTWIRLSGPVFQVDNTSSSNSLYIPAYSLLSGYDYTLELRVSYESTPWLFGTALVHIHVPNEAPAAILEGGTDRSWQLGLVPLTLDATASINYDNPPLPMIYHWNCTVVGNYGPLADQYFTPLQECFDEEVREIFLPSENSTVEIYSGGLGLGIYDFSLTLYGIENGPSSYVSSRVLTNSNGPNVLVGVRDVKNMFPANPNEQFTLQATVVSGGPVDWTWEVLTDNIDLNDENIVSSKLTSRRLILEPGAFASGVLYRFRIEGDNAGSLGFAELELLANARPNAGFCSVSPSSGIAVTTPFRIQCIQWEDDVNGQPHRYKFHIQGTTGLVALHAGFVSTNQLVAVLPAGLQTIVVYAYDAWGAYSSYSLTVSVSQEKKRNVEGEVNELETRQTQDTTDPLTLIQISLEQDMADFIQDGNTNAVGQMLYLSASTLNSIESDDLETKMDLRNQLGSILISDFAIEDTPSANLWRVQLVETLTEKPEEVSPELLVDLANYIYSLSGKEIVGDKDTLISFYNAISNIFTAAETTSSLTEDVSSPLRSSFNNLLEAQLPELSYGKSATTIKSYKGDIISRSQYDSVDEFGSLSQIDGDSVSFVFPQDFWDSVSTQDDRIIYQVLEFKSNIYYWASDEVIASITAFKLWDSDFEPITHTSSEFNVTFAGEFDTENPVEPACSIFDESTFTFQTCTLASLSEESVVCSCTDFSDFTVLQEVIIVGPDIVPPGQEPFEPSPSFPIFKEETNGVEFQDWILIVLVAAVGLLVLLFLTINHRRKRPKTNKYLWEKRLLQKQILNARAENVSDFSFSEGEGTPRDDGGVESEDTFTREERRRGRMATRLMRLGSGGLKPATHQDWEQRYATTRTHRPAFATEDEPSRSSGAGLLPSTTTRTNRPSNAAATSGPGPRKFSHRQISGKVGKTTTAYSRTEIEN